MSKVASTNTRDFARYAEKRRILRRSYSGAMSLTDLSAELRVSTDYAKQWGMENRLGFRIGSRIKYDTDMVAKRIVGLATNKDETFYRQIEEKRRILREEYGGSMTFSDVVGELHINRDAAKKWVEDNCLCLDVGKRTKIDTDMVAKRLVELRGMC